jgi:hypothetical protein
MHEESAPQAEQPKAPSIVCEMHGVIDQFRAMVAREADAAERIVVPAGLQQMLQGYSRLQRLKFLEAMALAVNACEIEADDAARGAKP